MYASSGWQRTDYQQTLLSVPLQISVSDLHPRHLHELLNWCGDFKLGLPFHCSNPNFLTKAVIETN